MSRGGYRANSGPAKGTKYRKRATTVTKGKTSKKPQVPADIAKEAKSENLDPLAYMLKVMNDPTADVMRRDNMARAAAPFVTVRKGEKGKKDMRQERARKAGQGKFAPSKPPILKILK